jgi:20S proteasome alpha/beta subunit
VTVCLATLFSWNYGGAGEPPSRGFVALTVSDRMITAGDIQYEPEQKKIAHLTSRALVLIAGDFSTHTQAIYEAVKNLRGKDDASPEEVAHVYARAIQSVKLRHAEDLILAPLGLNTDIFHAQQRDFSLDFVDRITNQLQNFRGEEVEALVVGGDGAHAHIYSVDSQGIVGCFDDVGFAAIGIGASHAKSQMMQAGHVNRRVLAPALATTYLAKKASEIAPGVGSATDINFVFRDKIEPIREDLFAQVELIYKNYEAARRELATKAVLGLDAALAVIGAEKHDDAHTPGFSGADQQGNGSA